MPSCPLVFVFVDFLCDYWLRKKILSQLFSVDLRFFCWVSIAITQILLVYNNVCLLFWLHYIRDCHTSNLMVLVGLIRESCYCEVADRNEPWEDEFKDFV